MRGGIWQALPNGEAPQSKPGKQHRSLTELPARIGLAVGTDKGHAHAAIRERPQHGVDTLEECDACQMFGLQPSHVPRDARQFPERDFKTPKDFARTETAQNLRRPASATRRKLNLLGDAIYVAEEPRKAIGERAVEIENDKLGRALSKRTRGVQWRNVLRLMSKNMRGGIRDAITSHALGGISLSLSKIFPCRQNEWIIHST